MNAFTRTLDGALTVTGVRTVLILCLLGAAGLAATALFLAFGFTDFF